MKEFAWIEKFFAPLATDPGAFALKDDAALLAAPPGCDLVLTQDAMTAGIHFFADDPPHLIARKLLRVNLSDLAAKGAEPVGYLLSLLLPSSFSDLPDVSQSGRVRHKAAEGLKRREQGLHSEINTPEIFLAEFASGLRQDQNHFEITLFGGDTSRICGPLTLSLTAIGSVAQGRMIRRRGAQPGDDLFVTGTVGDAALGLLVRRGELPENEFLLNRYLLPQPRFLHDTEKARVSACLDISDGLFQDAGHLASASGVRLIIEYDCLPLSEAARELLPQLRNPASKILAGGDDYELLFTAPPHEIAGNYTRIGHVSMGSGVAILDGSGQEIPLQNKGWSHF